MDDDEDGTWKGETCIETKGLFSACTSFKFVMSLVLAQNGLSYVEPATRKLQATKMEVVKAYSEIGLLKSTVETKRAQIEDAHKNWYKKAVELAEKVGTEPTMPRIAPRQTLPANAPAATPVEYYRINYSVPFLDHMIAQLEQRFSTDKIEILQSGFFLVPKYMNDALKDSPAAWKNSVLKFANHYKDDMPLFCSMNTELDIWMQYWSSRPSDKLPKKLSDTLEATVQMDTTFPAIYQLLKVLATIPITTCQCERCISRLMIIKTYMRSTMTEERLNGLALLSIHRDIDLNMDDIINRFARKNERRMSLINILDTDLLEKQKISELDIVLDL